VGSVEWQKKLFKAREQFVLNELAGKLFLARQDGKHIFETWMLHESDNVQALATAYGENIAIEQFDKTIGQVQNAAVKATLQKLFSLYALDRVLADGVFFLENGILNGAQTAAITAEVQRLCTDLGKDMLELTGSFGIPNHMHHAPIANNWEKYNATENDGELKDQSYRQVSKL
jgi:acyl-CoA oxidase